MVLSAGLTQKAPSAHPPPAPGMGAPAAQLFVALLYLWVLLWAVKLESNPPMAQKKLPRAAPPPCSPRATGMGAAAVHARLTAPGFWTLSPADGARSARADD